MNNHANAVTLELCFINSTTLAARNVDFRCQMAFDVKKRSRSKDKPETFTQESNSSSQVDSMLIFHLGGTRDKFVMETYYLRCRL